MSELTVAVIIPVYNRRHSVKEALASVRDQTYQHVHAIVIDDASTDGTDGAAASWIAEHLSGRGEVIRMAQNEGPSAARNRGLQVASGYDFIAFLDSDDLWPADYLSRMVAEFASRPRAVAATSDILRVDEKDAKRTRFPADGIEQDTAVWLITHRDSVLLSATVVRACFAQQTGPFREELRIAEDLEWFVRLSRLGDWCHCAGEPIVYRRAASEQRGEETNISVNQQGRFLTCAEVHEEIVQSSERLRHHPAIRKMLAHYWYMAGREAERAGNFGQAKRSFSRSLPYRFRLKASLHALSSGWRAFWHSKQKQPVQPQQA